MGFFKTFPVVFDVSYKLINDYLFKISNRNNPEDFTRSRKMGFIDVITFILGSSKKTLQIELNQFFKDVLKREEPSSKQAFSKAREKLKPKAFIELNDAINKAIYVDNNEYKLWRGFRVLAIDGSILEVPDTEELRNNFGYIENQNSKVSRAKASCIFDVINKIVVESKIGNYKSCERKMAMDMINNLICKNKMNELILFDRGYPSAEMVSFLVENDINFLMRVSKTFSNQIKNATKTDQIIKMKYNGKDYAVRVLRLSLDSGEEEILITSLLNEKLTIDDFKQLYFTRWGVEIKFDELKNRLQIENFTGNTRIAIEQDFYASIYLSNMIEISRSRCDESLEDKQEEKKNKYQHKVNLNVLVGTLKEPLILMLLEKSNRKRQKIFKMIMGEIIRSTIPIRPNRQNPRIKRMKSAKYCTNNKRAF